MITIGRDRVSHALRAAFNGTARVLVLILSSVTTGAQDAPSLSGKWVAHFSDSQGRDKEALVEIADSTGTWKDVAGKGKQAMRNSCLGHVFPITVTINEAGVIKIHVEESQTISGCGNHTMALKVIDKGTLEGTLNSGGAMKFVRQ
jgi:hypothetical protein